MYTMISMLILITLWLVLSTDLVLRPTAIHYDKTTVTLVRETPFGPVWARHSTVIKIAGTNEQCVNSGAMEKYEPIEDNVDTYELGSWADRCINIGPPLIFVDTWQVMLFGIIPIRPYQLVTVLEITEGKLP